jgi:hypothetical protein
MIGVGVSEKHCVNVIDTSAECLLAKIWSCID